jgi:hypothetical protein
MTRSTWGTGTGTVYLYQRDIVVQQTLLWVLRGQCFIFLVPSTLSVRTTTQTYRETYRYRGTGTATV